MIGWVIAILIAVLEAGITVRVFGLDLTHLGWGSLTWLAVTAALVIFNHYMVEVAGARQRDYREIRKQNRLLHREAFGRIHHGDGEKALGGTAVAGLAAGPTAEQEAKRRRTIAMIALFIPLVLLLTAAYMRFYDFVGRIIPGAFGYLFPAVLVSLVGGLIFWMVDRASRGTVLGDRIRAAADADSDIVDNDESLHDTAEQLIAERNRELTTARALLTQAESKAVQGAAAAERGRNYAAAVSGVMRELPPLSSGGSRRLAWLEHERIREAIERELERAATLDPAALTSHLTPTTTTTLDFDTPWRELTPAAQAPEIGMFDHPFVQSHPQAQSRRLWTRNLAMTLGAGVLFLVVGVALLAILL